jgi:hypothetical protein
LAHLIARHDSFSFSVSKDFLTLDVISEQCRLAGFSHLGPTPFEQKSNFICFRCNSAKMQNQTAAENYGAIKVSEIILLS